MSDSLSDQPGTPIVETEIVETDEGGLAFVCPRCDRRTTERFYGPCGPCRADLVAAHAGEGRDVEAARFEPRMHVTPNAVATKD